ncbi:uncharacterized protein [Argopecten irradians]|uniref:uncharacterized protein n=1 Tax=Argopecten irradians TaxID=31199 RepID=UPI003722707F
MPNTLFCNTETAEGPWIVIQRKFSALVDFQRTWNEYKSGFGDLHGDFWIGNEFLHRVTSISRVLRIELEFVDGSKGYAQYSTFKVAGEDQKYRLVVQDYSGDLVDKFSSADGSFFTTTDVDNDQSPGSNCADDFGGGWWYGWCSPINLNGGYKNDQGYDLFWNQKSVKKSAEDRKCQTYSQLVGSGTAVAMPATDMYFYKNLVLRECSDLPLGYPSRAYHVTRPDGVPHTVFCDMDEPDGPWNVMQRRINELTDFQLTWDEYKRGFGDPYGNVWVGNEFLHLLTKTPRVLRINMDFVDGTNGYAQYSNFQVAEEANKYQLVLNGYSGDRGDYIDEADGSFFTTTDADNDQSPGSNCADDYGGGWWYWWCSPINLNGRYKYQGNYALNWKLIRVTKSVIMFR